MQNGLHSWSALQIHIVLDMFLMVTAKLGLFSVFNNNKSITNDVSMVETKW